MTFQDPTGHGVRGTDAYGSGHFLAPRGGRPHWGVDYIATPGQEVTAPCHGKIKRVRRPYADDMSYLGVLIEADWGALITMFYVDPEPRLIGARIVAGSPIGVAQTLQARYPGITDHVHCEVRLPKSYALPLVWVRGRDYEMRTEAVFPGTYCDTQLIGG